MFMREIQLYFRLYNLPFANHQPSSQYQLDVLHHPNAPCDNREVRLDIFDTTDVRQKISTGDAHTYLTFILNEERRYEIVAGQGFIKQICFVAKFQVVRAQQFLGELFTNF
jgi:hypothetical protein